MSTYKSSNREVVIINYPLLVKVDAHDCQNVSAVSCLVVYFQTENKMCTV